MLPTQTVAAISTPPGAGGIAVVRLSGPSALQIASRIFRPKNPNKSLENTPGYSALFGDFISENKPFDEGVALVFRAPHSYTGEDVVELSCHGGVAVTRLLLTAALTAGAAPAPAGEFTRRAVLNGRMDLSQAEAVMDLISATSSGAAKLAGSALRGALYSAIHPIRQTLTDLAGHLAAWSDFPEEDVDALDVQTFLATLQSAEARLATLLSRHSQGEILRRGVPTAIVGSPNVGKSTLFNLLTGLESAIVTPIAGTTRDVVRSQVEIAGIPLLLADTAGLHQTTDMVEAEGIRRSRQELAGAGLVLAVFDASKPLNAQELQLAQGLQGRPAIALLNKADKGVQTAAAALRPWVSSVLVLSLHEKESSLTRLEAALRETLGLHHFDPDAASIANDRQLAAANSALSSIKSAIQTLQAGYTMDAAGVLLQEALTHLAALTGDNAAEDVINNVFSRFCVGK